MASWSTCGTATWPHQYMVVPRLPPWMPSTRETGWATPLNDQSGRSRPEGAANSGETSRIERKIGEHVAFLEKVSTMIVMVHAPWTGQILFTPHSDGTMASLTPLPAQNRHNTVTDPHHPCAKEAVSGNSRKSCLFSLRTVCCAIILNYVN